MSQGKKNVQSYLCSNPEPLAYRASALPTELPGLTAHFSHPVTFGAQRRTVHACLVSLRRLEMKFTSEIRERILHVTVRTQSLKGNNVSGRLVAKSVEQSPCKLGVPHTSPILTALFSKPRDTYQQLQLFSFFMFLKVSGLRFRR